MHIRIFYLLKAAFLLREFQQSTNRITYKPKKKTQNILFLRTDFLSKPYILTKTKKNLVIIASSLWTRYLLKKIIWEANIDIDIIYLPLVCICSHFDGTPSPLNADLITKCPLLWYDRTKELY